MDMFELSNVLSLWSRCCPFSPYCSAMIRYSPPVCMVGFPRGCRDRSLVQAEWKGQRFQRKTIKPFWVPTFSQVPAVWEQPAVLFTRNRTGRFKVPCVGAGQSLTALLLRQSSTRGCTLLIILVCACIFWICAHGWLNFSGALMYKPKTANCFEPSMQ